MKDSSQFEEIFQVFTIKFENEKEGDIEQFLDMKFTKETKENHITNKFDRSDYQKDVNLHDKNGKLPNTPTKSSSIFQQYEYEENNDDKRFHIRSLIGKLNYLEKFTRMIFHML